MHFKKRTAQPALLAVVAAGFLLGAPLYSHATDPDSAPYIRGAHDRLAIVSLYSADVQPISRNLAFRVDEASVKDRQLWVIGEVINASRATFSQVRLVVGIEHGAEQRLTVGRLAPGASRRVQARLATDFEHAPRYLHIVIVEVVQDYRPKPQRWP